MKKYKIISLVFTISVLLFFGCESDDGLTSPMATQNIDNTQTQSLSKVGRGMIWADGILFHTIGTPATFKSSSSPFDQLYTGSFKDGIGAISEAKPGDQDYNGGRWHVNVLKEGVDAGKYMNASSVEDLDLNDFESTDTYFECPLLPRRNH